MATPEKELTLEDLTRLFETQISAIQDLSALENLRVEWMGKRVTSLCKCAIWEKLRRLKEKFLAKKLMK